MVALQKLQRWESEAIEACGRRRQRLTLSDSADVRRKIRNVTPCTTRTIHRDCTVVVRLTTKEGQILRAVCCLGLPLRRAGWKRAIRWLRSFPLLKSTATSVGRVVSRSPIHLLVLDRRSHRHYRPTRVRTLLACLELLRAHCVSVAAMLDDA